jgi:hypothetical protein
VQNTKSRAPTNSQEDRLKDGERGAVRERQKRTDTVKQQDRVLKEEEKEEEEEKCKYITQIYSCGRNYY